MTMDRHHGRPGISSTREPPFASPPFLFAQNQSAACVPARSIRRILQKEVKNPRGQCLGRIDDLIIDLDAGVIAYAILAVVHNVREPLKFFAIPWHALNFNPAAQQFVLAVEQDALRDAPGLDRERDAREYS